MISGSRLSLAVMTKNDRTVARQWSRDALDHMPGISLTTAKQTAIARLARVVLQFLGL